jgi:CDP-glucose 4,6-dehydratase
VGKFAAVRLSGKCGIDRRRFSDNPWMMTQAGFWHEKRVFVTGQTGFKGGWLCLWLSMLGAKVGGYALEPDHPQGIYCQAQVSASMDSVYGDILDVPSLQRALARHQPELVIHMAAQPLVRESYRNPADTFAVNTMGTVNVLEAMRHTPSVKACLVITTDKCYENRNNREGYTEADRLGGHDPYSASKACAELVVASYRDSFFAPAGIGIATARAGNVIGGGDWATDRLIPDVMRGLFNQTPVQIRYPEAIRPWQHVLEALSGYLKLSRALYENPQEYSDAWNFAPTLADAQPVSHLIQHIAQAWPEPLQWELNTDDQPHETAILTLNATKANDRLDWHPRLGLEEALRYTVEWYRALFQQQDMRGVTQAQIRCYQQALPGLDASDSPASRVQAPASSVSEKVGGV